MLVLWQCNELMWNREILHEKCFIMYMIKCCIAISENNIDNKNCKS